MGTARDKVDPSASDASDASNGIARHDKVAPPHVSRVLEGLYS